MNDAIVKTSTACDERSRIVPMPRIAITVRPGVASDISFIDGLQKQHTHMVGWMPMNALEGKIKLGHVLVAEEGGLQVAGCGLEVGPNPQPTTHNPHPVGYCIGNDQYFKRDDV